MAYAARHPEQVNHLVICDGAAPKIAETKTLYQDIFPDISEKRDAADKSSEKDAYALWVRYHFSMLCCSREKAEAGQEQFAKGKLDWQLNTRIYNG